MTTNQTIDGVPRALLQSLYTDTLQQWGVGGNAASQLRALLDKTDADIPASTPQGEPVAVASLEIVGRQCFPSETMKKIPNYRTEPWVDGDVHQSPSVPGLYRVEPLVRLSDVTRLNTK